MNVISINGHVFDSDEVLTKERRAASVLVRFRNGDTIDLRWRDEDERAEICRALQIPESELA